MAPLGQTDQVETAKREEMHLLSGYYERKGGPVRGGSPGSGRRC